MAIPNYTYLKLKMSGPNGVITIGPTYRHAYECDVECVEYAEALTESEALIADLMFSFNSISPFFRFNLFSLLLLNDLTVF